MFITAPSETLPGTEYMVDTFLGAYKCAVGKGGAPCKHQYDIWSSQKNSNPNFMPFFSQEERQRFTVIAIGASLLKSWFDPLHTPDNLGQIDISINESISIDLQISSENSEVTHNNINEDSSNFQDAELQKQQSIRNLEEAFDTLRALIENGNNLIMDGVRRFNCRLQKLSANKFSSALHTFGSQKTFRVKENNNFSRMLIKRGQRKQQYNLPLPKGG